METIKFFFFDQRFLPEKLKECKYVINLELEVCTELSMSEKYSPLDQLQSLSILSCGKAFFKRNESFLDIKYLKKLEMTSDDEDDSTIVPGLFISI